jgi:predicted Zn-dependent protease
MGQEARARHHSAGEVQAIFMEAGKTLDAMWMTQRNPQFLAMAGYAYEEAGLLPDALKRLQAAASYSPGDPAIHLQYGDALLEAGQVSAGMAELDRAVILAPGAKGKRDEVIANWRAATQGAGKGQ